MKIYKEYLIGFIIFSIVPSFSQNSDKLTDNDSSLVKLIDSYSSQNEFDRKLNSISFAELKHIAGIVYMSYDKDPLIINKAIENHRHFNLRPYYLKSRLVKSIKKQQSILDSKLLDIPCLVKAKIIDITKINYKVLGGPPGIPPSFLPRIDITIHIDEVFKGKGYFKEKDTITFYYFPMWRPTIWNFNIGETCLLPLQPLIDNNTDEIMIAIVAWLEEPISDTGALDTNNTTSYGRYPIIDGEFFDRGNSFGVGTKVEWEKFRSLIINEIDKIKSW